MNGITKHRLELKHIASFLAIIVSLLLFLRVGTIYKTEVDSDGATAALHAAEILRTHNLFPKSWYGVTFFQPFDFITLITSLFTADWTRAKMLAGFFMTASFLLALWCFTAKGLKNNKVLPYLIIVFCSPISSCWENTLFINFFYTHHFIFALISLTLYFNFFTKNNISHNNFPRTNRKFILLLTVFFFVTLLGGLRTAQQIIIPFVASIFILFLIEDGTKQLDNSAVLKSFLHSIALITIILVIGGIGTILAEKILNPLTGVSNRTQNYVTTFLISYNDLSNNAHSFFAGLIHELGIPTNISMFSKFGLIGIWKFFFMFSVVFVFPIIAIINFKKLDYKMKFLLLFSLINFAEVFFILFFGSAEDWTACARYLHSSIFFLTLFSIVLAFNYCSKNKTMFRIIFFCAIIAFAILTPLQSITKTKGYKTKLSQMKELTDFLSQNGLTYGYATYWNAYNNTFLSNGKVQINGVFVKKDSISPFLWSSSSDWYKPEYHTGKTFLMLTRNELNTYTENGTIKDERITGTLSYEEYTILVYEDNIFGSYRTLDVPYIKFYGNDANASKFCLGISHQEDGFTWTEGKKLTIRFKTNENLAGKKILAEFSNGVFNGSQRVIASVSGKKVFDEQISGGFSFIFTVNDDGFVDMHLEFPDAIAPYDVGFNEDRRVLALSLQQINFSIISESENLLRSDIENIFD